jgi:hypothetical protein
MMFRAGGEFMRIGVISATAIGLALGACAGRDPEGIAVVQPQDQYSTCAMISAEIQANNVKVKELADEQGLKVAQNVAAGVVGIVIWPVWFALDAKGAATKDVAALQARQQYLASLAVERCAQRAPAAAPPPPRRAAPKSKPKADEPDPS